MKNEIWRWFGNQYKCHCRKKKDYQEIMSWTGSEYGGVYLIPNEPNEYDVIISNGNLNRAKKLMKLKTKGGFGEGLESKSLRKERRHVN